MLGRAPRADDLVISFREGRNLWREPNPAVGEGVQQLGPAIRLGAGVYVGPQVALFIEGAGTVPAVLPGGGVEVGGIGGGTDLFLRAGGPWHVRVSVRRAWAYRSRAFQAPIRFVPPPIRRIDEIGLVHGHHIKHWLHGGVTSLDNLVLLCAWHHRLLHEAGFSAILRPDGELEVRTPEGALLPTHPALATDRPIVEWDAGADQWHGDRDDPEVDEWTTMPSWDGERMDLGWGVGTLV